MRETCKGDEAHKPTKHQRRCARRRSAGLCVRCGQPSETYRCASCHAANRRFTFLLRRRRIQAGRCRDCGAESEGKLLCARHRAAQGEAQRRWRSGGGNRDAK